MTGLRRAALGALLSLSACAHVHAPAGGAVVDHWSAPSVDAARRLMDRYGVPQEVEPDSLAWLEKGPCLRTRVLNRPRVYRSLRDFDLIVSTVRYPVTRAQAAELVAFSGALTVDVERGEISSSATREEVNFLILNLADEVARGRKSVPEAQVAYRRVLDLSAAGKTSPYMTGLRFPGR